MLFLVEISGLVFDSSLQKLLNEDLAREVSILIKHYLDFLNYNKGPRRDRIKRKFKTSIQKEHQIAFILRN